MNMDPKEEKRRKKSSARTKEMLVEMFHETCRVLTRV